MQISLTFLLATLILFMVREVPCNQECGVSSNGHILNLSVKSKRNETGEWVTTFSARKDSETPLNDLNVDVTHKFMECDGMHTIFIMGVAKEMANENRLRFHRNCGTNVRITGHGRSAEKINLEDGLNGVLLTSRPLRPKEIFEVRIDAKDSKFTDSIGIGVTTHSPDVLVIPRHMNTLNSGTWMTYLGNVYKNGSVLKLQYSKNTMKLNIGDRIGVMRNASGALHFFVNGIDQGLAASDVPHPIYGVLELYYNAVKVTITDNYV